MPSIFIESVSVGSVVKDLIVVVRAGRTSSEVLSRIRQESERAGTSEFFHSENDKFRFKQNVKMFIPPVLVNLVQSFRRGFFS